MKKNILKKYMFLYDREYIDLNHSKAVIPSLIYSIKTKSIHSWQKYRVISTRNQNNLNLKITSKLF